MKYSLTRFSLGVMLSSAVVVNAYGGNSISKATAQNVSTHTEQYKMKSKTGFNPPRQISPHQFEQLLQSKKSIDDLYQKQIPKAKTTRMANLLVNTGCSSPNHLQALTDSALVESVKLGNLNSCLYGLFDQSLKGTSVFSDQSLLTIIEALNKHLESYDGNNPASAAELENLVIYLRAMHWVEWGSNRVFPNQYLTGLQSAFTQYFSGENFSNFNGTISRDFMVRYEMLILLRSSDTSSLPYLERMTEALLGYANTVNQDDNWGVYYEENGVTQILTHLFNSSENLTTELEQQVLAQPNIISNLKSFVDHQGKWLIGHTREYQWADTVNELARFLRFGGDIANDVRPSIQNVLSQYSHQGAGSQGWLKAQSSVSFYDSQNCNLYGDACEFDLEKVVLSGNHVCSSTLKLRFQEPINQQNLSQICQDLSVQELAFHQMFNTNTNTPVVNDENTDLEVVIFSTYTDYDNYAGNFFGINTNNGGIYLEGTPWDQNNQARFIAHQASWLSEFQVWNLNHEYVHYLDGRFNKWGGFGDQPENSVWWSEGLAEYLSQPNNNPNALAVAAAPNFSLSELFQTTYANSNTERTYYWGYLAARFMLENQTSEIETTLLPSFRAAKYVVATGECLFDWGWKTKSQAIENDWYWTYDDSEWSSGSWVMTCGQPKPEQSEIPEFTPYTDILTTWNTQFDLDFSQWLTCLVAGNGECLTEVIRQGDLDENNAIDKRDIDLFNGLLRSNTPLSLDYDFNQDGKVDRRDIRSLMALCDLPRCNIAPQ